MKREFIFVFYFENFAYSLFKDLEKDDRATLFKLKKQQETKFLKLISEIHLSSKVNKTINLPFKTVWLNSLDSVISDPNTEYHVIFVSQFCPINKSFASNLNEKKKKYRIMYYIMMIDAWDNAPFANDYKKLIDIDHILTFDEKDAERYGFLFHYVPYSMIGQAGGGNEIKYDLYFAGNKRGSRRLELLHNIYNNAKENEVSSIYRIGLVPENEQRFKDGIIYNQIIKYSEIVEETKRCNCILETFRDNQSGATLRYYEAVCYNKKLLTTNKNVVNLPFYNPEYIHVFEKPEDIDWDWVKERIQVDYHYDGRFSPTNFIDTIIEMEEEKKKAKQ